MVSRSITLIPLLLWACNGLAIDQQVLGPPAEASHKSPFERVQHKLKDSEIIPTVLDDFLPSFLLEASWSSKTYASLGNTLKVDDVQDEPTIAVHQPGSDKLSNGTYAGTYAITLTDPDAPSRSNPEWAEMCHYIASITVPSEADISSPMVLSGLDTIMPYKPPGPPPKTGKHRYVFVLFAPQNGTTDRLNLTKPEDRQHWGTGKEGHGVRDWAADNGLAPIGANFIFAQNKEQ